MISADPIQTEHRHREPAPESRSLQAFCRRWDMAVSTAYRLISDGKLTAHKLGRRTVILPESEAAFAASLPQRAINPAKDAA